MLAMRELSNTVHLQLCRLHISESIESDSHSSAQLSMFLRVEWPSFDGSDQVKWWEDYFSTVQSAHHAIALITVWVIATYHILPVHCLARPTVTAPRNT